MPKYVFDCPSEGCNLRFERTLKMGKVLTHTCPNCGDTAPRVLAGEGFAFAFASSDKAAPANTGVHKDDYPTADHLIGKDAEQRWATYDEQAKAKNQARSIGNTHALIRRQGKDYVDYEPMTKNGLASRKRLADQAMASIRKDVSRGR